MTLPATPTNTPAAPPAPPSPPRRPLWQRGLVGLLAAGFGLLLLLLGLLATTFSAAGMAQWVRAAEWLSGGALAVAEVQGSLASPLRLQEIRFDTATTHLSLSALQLDWQPRALLSGRVQIDRLALGKTHYAAAPSDSLPPTLPDSLRLPLAVTVQSLEIAELVLSPTAPPLTDLRLALHSDGGQHALTLHTLHSGGYQMHGAFSVAADAPFALTGTLTAEGRWQDQALGGVAHLSGTLAAPVLAAGAFIGEAGLGMDVTLAPFAATPLAMLRRIELRAEGLNLARLGLGSTPTQLSVTMTSAAQAVPLSPAAAAAPSAAPALPSQQVTVQVNNATPAALHQGGLPVTRLTAEATLDPQGITLTDLTTTLLHGTWTAKGRLSEAALDLHSQLVGVDTRQFSPDSPLTALGGTLTVSGQPALPRVTLDLAEGRRTLQAAFSLSGTPSQRQWQLAHLRLTEGAARLEASGHGGLTAPQPFTLTAQLTAFDPARFVAAPSGLLNATLTAEGTQFPRLAAWGRADIRDSRFNNQPLSGTAELAWSGARATGLDLTLRLGDNRLTAKGAMGGRADALTFAIQAPNLAQIGKGFAGRAEGGGTVAGDWQSLHMDARLTADQLRLPEGIRADQLTASAKLGTVPDAPFALAVRAKNISVAALTLDHADIQGEGKIRQHSFRAEARGRLDAQSFDAKLEASGGSPEAGQWRGRVLRLVNAGSVPVAAEAPFSLNLAPQRVEVGAVGLRVLDSQLNLSRLRWDGARLDTAGRWRGIAPARFAALLNRPLPWESTLSLAADWDAQWGGATPSGKLNLTRESGDVVLKSGERAWARRVPLGLSDLALTLSSTGARPDLQFRLAAATLGQHSGRVALGLGKNRAGQPVLDAKTTLDGTWRGTLPSVAWLGTLVKSGLRLEGQLTADTKLGGTLGAPRLTGSVRGDKLAVSDTDSGLALDKGQALLTLTGEAVRIDALSFQDTHGGHITATGGLALNAAAPQAKATVRFDHFAALAAPNRSLLVSGDADLAWQNNVLALTGQLRADKGRIALPAADLPELDDDVVRVGHTPPPPAPAATPVRVALDVDLGDQFRLYGRGLEARLAGQLHISSSPTETLKARGAVRVEEGRYTAYGQQLTIERGVVSFVGQLDNPGLDIVALRKRQAVEAGVEISGTALAPRVRLVSTPDLPDREKLSWLVLGRGTDNLKGSDTGLLFTAANTLLSAGESSNLQRQVTERLGLDDISLTSADTRNANTVSASRTAASTAQSPLSNRVVSFGKRLSDTLYMSYEQGLTGTSSALKLTWQWSQHWSLVTRAGEDSAVDVFYTLAFE